MRAILLAAGMGTRLKPLTNSIPKCLVKIKGEYLLEIWLEKLTNASIDRILINTHHLAEEVNNFLSQSKYKNKVDQSFEPKLLGTAGTLIANIKFSLGEDLMLIHADNYCVSDLKEFIFAHNNRPKNCVMTMMTFRTNNPSSCGVVEINEKGVLINFHEKKPNPPSNLANGAIYIISANILERFSTDLNLLTDFSTEVINKFYGSIYTYETKELFIDIGTYENLIKANNS